MSKNADKSPSTCLELLLSRISDIQAALPDEYRDDKILRDKLLNAVQDVIDCLQAYHKPADTVQGVISDLHASLAMTSRHQPPPRPVTNGLDINYVDLRYVQRVPKSHKNRLHRNDKKCLVCHRQGCWSTNHSTKDLLNAFRKNKALRQLIGNLPDDDNSNDDDRQLADALEDVTAHLVDMSLTKNDEDDRHEPSDVFFHIWLPLNMSTLVHHSLVHCNTLPPTMP